MLIQKPLQNESISVTLGNESSGFLLEIYNNNETKEILIDEQTFKVQAKNFPYPQQPENDEVHHQLEALIEEQINQVIREKFNHSRFWGTQKWVRIESNSIMHFNVSLNELSRDSFFKEQIKPSTTFDVTITTTAFDQKTRFYLILTVDEEETVDDEEETLDEEAGKTADDEEDKTVPTPDTPRGYNPMIILKKRVTLNLTEGGTLLIDLDEEGAGQEWLTKTKVSDSPTALETSVDIVPEEGTDLPESVKNTVISALAIQEATIVKKPDQGVVIKIPLKRNEEEPLTQDLPVTLKLTFAKATEYNVPALLQRPAYLGFAAIDFGTSNSACVYYSPHEGPSSLPGRTLSPVQTTVLRETVENLMNELEEKSNDAQFQPLATHFIKLAGDLITEDWRVRTFADIRNYFKTLRKTAQEPSYINKMYAKLLVSWGSENYAALRRTQGEAVAKSLARKYHACLDSIINTDIQADSSLFLPELERGRKDGKIFSAILLDELVQQEERQDRYPTVHPFKSKIRMGTAVGLTMKQPREVKQEQEPKEQPLKEQQVYKDSRKEVHKYYVTGVKRWLGQSFIEAYFVDRKDNIFEDNYDPFSKLGIKYLITQTEKFLNPGDQPESPGSKCLNNLVVTYPTSLSQHRRQHLEELVESLGASRIDLRFDEATAAALYYVWRELFTDTFAGIDGFLARSRVREEWRISKWTGAREKVKLHFQNLLLYDMGGGTTDIALLEIGIGEVDNIARDTSGNWGRCFVIYPRILGLTGRENFAGDNVTLAIFRLLKSKLAARLAELLLQRKEVQQPQELSEVLQEIERDPQKTVSLTAWIQSGDQKEFEDKVKAKINTLVPTNFHDNANLQTPFFELWRESENIKCDLSTEGAGHVATAQAPTLFNVVDHLQLGIQTDDLLGLEVTREEMEQAILLDVKNTFEKARNLCVGLKNGQPVVEHYIDRVILAGSSSQLRLVREVMPYDILGKPFEITVAGVPYPLPAPFKNDGHNLLFESKEAKLAVARGACLGHYFREHSIPPTHSEVPNHLRKGIDFLYFDIDNLHSYIPFTVGYNLGTGTGSAILFAAGKEFNVLLEGEGGKKIKVARTKVSPVEMLRCYRFDNVTQAESGIGGELYCQFDLFGAVAHHKHLDVRNNRGEIEKLINQYLFYVQLDVDRNLTCYMYTHPNGNARESVKCQVDEAQLKVAFCQEEQDVLEWKPDFALECDLSLLGGQGEHIYFETDASSNQRGALCGKAAIRCSEDRRGGVYNIRAKEGDGTLLWQINLSDDKVKMPEFAELRLYLNLDDPTVLGYMVYDPDIADSIEIHQSYDDRVQMKLFNPFSGEE